MPSQKLILSLVQLPHCSGCILFGSAAATVFLFFGSIDWTVWNVVKDRVTSRKSPGDDRRPPHASADG